MAMKRAALLAVVMTAAMSMATAEAADRSSAPAGEPGATSRAKSSAQRRVKPQVRGFVARRGGYSYTWTDTINTYGDSRTRYSGGANFFRDPNIDRQSSSGPFDHGFFFDSGIGRIGGNSPYLN